MVHLLVPASRCEEKAMWDMLWPMMVIVGSSTVYNVCAKSTPSEVNPFLSLLITYLVAAVCTLVMIFATRDGQNITEGIAKTNWSSWVLGIAVVGLEFGFLMAYRNGWPVSYAQLVSNSIVAVALVFAGVGLFQEALTLRQAAGMLVCAAGLALVVA